MKAIPREVEEAVEITVEQRDVVIGCILGDGYVYPNGRLQIEHCFQQSDYVCWKYKQLSNLVSGPIAECNRYDNRTNRTYKSSRFYTKILFQEYRSLFYQDGKKHVPSNLENLLRNPLALAVWFMDDGGKGGNSPKGMVINTSCFQINEQEILKDCLKVNFGIGTNIHKVGSGFQLYITANYADTFFQLISKSIIPSMLYKLPLTL
jgi:hypothetical protein